MNLAVASDLRSEQLVKVVKNWPESGSRNIISWWRKVIFSTQEELINTVPYIPPYEKSFRAISLFFKTSKRKPKQKPVLLMSLTDGVQNVYSRVWPLLNEKEFCTERATVNKQVIHKKGGGLKNTLTKASELMSGKAELLYPYTPLISQRNRKRNQLNRGSPLEENLGGKIKKRKDHQPLPTKLPKPLKTRLRSNRRPQTE